MILVQFVILINTVTGCLQFTVVPCQHDIKHFVGALSSKQDTLTGP